MTDEEAIAVLAEVCRSVQGNWAALSKMMQALDHVKSRLSPSEATPTPKG